MITSRFLTIIGVFCFSLAFKVMAGSCNGINLKSATNYEFLYPGIEGKPNPGNRLQNIHFTFSVLYKSAAPINLRMIKGVKAVEHFYKIETNSTSSNESLAFDAAFTHHDKSNDRCLIYFITSHGDSSSWGNIWNQRVAYFAIDKNLYDKNIFNIRAEYDGFDKVFSVLTPSQKQ